MIKGKSRVPAPNLPMYEADVGCNLYEGSVRVLILRSTTVGSFCAGADLAERRTMSQIQVAKFLADLRDALGKLESLPMPTIAAIDGPALGGGLEMSLACDLRVAGMFLFHAGPNLLSLGQTKALSRT